MTDLGQRIADSFGNREVRAFVDEQASFKVAALAGHDGQREALSSS